MSLYKLTEEIIEDPDWIKHACQWLPKIGSLIKTQHTLFYYYNLLIEKEEISKVNMLGLDGFSLNNDKALTLSSKTSDNDILVLTDISFGYKSRYGPVAILKCLLNNSSFWYFATPVLILEKDKPGYPHIKKYLTVISG